mmetsp:Transcript_117330/g.230163  ORF Transcript_117330/g.230163 Transcript_117330/m.230163 type:complete len:221 (+) Transcript_117330:365-1027(+)
MAPKGREARGRQREPCHGAMRRAASVPAAPVVRPVRVVRTVRVVRVVVRAGPAVEAAGACPPPQVPPPSAAHAGAGAVEQSLHGLGQVLRLGALQLLLQLLHFRAVVGPLARGLRRLRGGRSNRRLLGLLRLLRFRRLRPGALHQQHGALLAEEALVASAHAAGPRGLTAAEVGAAAQHQTLAAVRGHLGARGQVRGEGHGLRRRRRRLLLRPPAADDGV